MRTSAVTRGNLAAALPDARRAEQLELLASGSDARVERIVSHGQGSPEGFWYEQPQREWVLVVAGRAALALEGDTCPIELGPGDWLDIPARHRHRVLWTAAGEPTIWLAVHYGDPVR